MLSDWRIPYRLLIQRILVAFLFFTLGRVVFALMNPVFTGYFTSFFYGLRYDAASICLLYSLFIFLHIFPNPWFYTRIYQIFLAVIFHLINAITLLFNLVDSAWFPFTGKRTTADFFRLINQGDDVNNNLITYLTDYWYLVILWIILLIMGARLYKKNFSIADPSSFRHKLPSKLILFIIFTGLTLLGARGGIQYKPLSVQAAARLSTPENIPLIVNTPYTILKSLGDQPLPGDLYMDINKAHQYFSLNHIPADTGNIDKLNIVILVLESFSSEYTGANPSGTSYTPFLDSLSRKSLSFPRCFANGKRSIEGIPSILSSLPALMDEPFITSLYNSNQVISLPILLKSQGYTSAFFHGGNNGTMGFDNFVKLAGYKEYFGRKEYDGPQSDYDGSWGIYDEPFYRFMIRWIDKQQSPFITSFFSLSSHHPYSLPAEYQGKFEEGTMPIHKSIRYGDASLRIFFELAATKNWFNNTLFIITADHTGPAETDYYNSPTGLYRIPLIFYMPGRDLKGTDLNIAQQTDIIPTVLGLMNYNNRYKALGNNLLDKQSKRWSVNYSNGRWQLITSDYILHFDGQETTGFYSYKNDSLLQHNLINENRSAQPQHEMLIKSILQQYRQAMIYNKLISD